MASLVDRREHLRYQINLPVLIFYSGKKAIGHTLDVGLGGMRIYSEQGFPYGRKMLFHLLLKKESIWVKGRLIFKQTDPELMNFSCICFEKDTIGSNIELQEFLSRLEKFLQKDRLDRMVRIRKAEASLAKVNELLEVESERVKRGEEILKEIGDRPKDFSIEFKIYQEKKLKRTVQGLQDSIEALILAINYGLKDIRILLKGESVSDQPSFEQIIFNIEKNYVEIRKILDNLQDVGTGT